MADERHLDILTRGVEAWNSWRILLAIGISVALFLIVALIGSYAFGWQWTGFADATLWDWLRLAIVPVSLAVAAYLFNLSLRKRIEFVEDQREQQNGLEAYLDQLIELSVDKDLRNREELSDIRLLTRARTLTLLWRLDADRKRSLLQFLQHEAKLDGADLKGAVLRKANLRGADLGGADLGVYDETQKKADLSGADLSDANLRNAKGVDNEELTRQATSLTGATLTDGRKHP